MKLFTDGSGKRKTKKTTSKLKEITIKDKKNLCNFLSEFAEKLGIEINDEDSDSSWKFKA